MFEGFMFNEMSDDQAFRSEVFFCYKNMLTMFDSFGQLFDEEE